MQRKFKSAMLWLRMLALVMMTGAAASVWAGDRAGSVSFVIGDASVLAADGKSHTLARGETVDAGQILVTGASGHIHMQMIDGAFVIVRPKSRLRIEEYRYDPAQPTNNRIKFFLEEGVARSITGKAGEASKENYRLNTPLAAIGIRGTDYVVQVDRSATRVTVGSGAIVMSPLGDDCLASAFGPCKSASTRVLTAAMHDSYLELRSRNEAPLLVPAEKSLEAPNVISPPRADEPRMSAEKVNKVTAAAETGDMVRAAAVDSIKTKVDTSSPVTQPPALGSTNGTTTTVPPEVVVVSPPPVVAPATQFWWGRWSNFIQPGQESKDYVVATDALNPGRVLAGGNDVFGMRRLGVDGDVVMPTSGVAKFTLADSEAYFMKNGTSLTSAAVSNASLTVDFGGQTYQTALTMTAAGYSTLALQSQGQVTNQGRLLSGQDAATSLNGSLSKDTSQAGYVFQRDLGGGTTAVGATRWYR
jgi:hypothetical protein